MKKGNLIAAAAFSALAIYVLLHTSGFPASKRGVPGPAVFPNIIAVIMLLASLSLVVTSLRMTPNEDRPLCLLTRDNVRVYISMALLVIYVAVMPVLGFCSASFLLLLGLIKWFGKYRIPVCALCSFLATGSVYAVFSELLNVPFRFGVVDSFVKGLF